MPSRSDARNGISAKDGTELALAIKLAMLVEAEINASSEWE